VILDNAVTRDEDAGPRQAADFGSAPAPKAITEPRSHEWRHCWMYRPSGGYRGQSFASGSGSRAI